jgi:PPK2 family polyphosphate:nucleotide phosphotransferase
MSGQIFKPDRFRVAQNHTVDLDSYDPEYTGDFKGEKHSKALLQENVERIGQLQYKLYAENRRALLIVFQAMDAAGKDSAIKHIMSGVNPQGCEVHSFKHPSVNELEHDYLWRHYTALPDRGRISIFNRSHYENVLITRVHPELILAENLPGIFSVNDIPAGLWHMRFRQINNFEKTISENGITTIKFFLHLSKQEQRKRFLDRIEREEKNWKFSHADLEERHYWDDYQLAYSDVLSHTSTNEAPWYIVPADNKWFSRVVISNVIAHTLEQMNLKLPTLTDEEAAQMDQALLTLNTELRSDSKEPK